MKKRYHLIISIECNGLEVNRILHCINTIDECNVLLSVQIIIFIYTDRICGILFSNVFRLTINRIHIVRYFFCCSSSLKIDVVLDKIVSSLTHFSRNIDVNAR